MATPPGINSSSSTLYVGNLPSSPGVSIGKTGAITVNNSTTPPSIAFAGPVTSTTTIDPLPYQIRVNKTAVQATVTATAAVVIFEAIETTGGGADNFPFTAGTGVFTIPVNGTYTFNSRLQFAANATNAAIGRQAWFSVNDAVGTARRYGGVTAIGTAVVETTLAPTFTYRFVAGDVVRLWVYQDSGAGLNVTYTALTNVPELVGRRVGS